MKEIETRHLRRYLAPLVATAAMALCTGAAHASIAYGSVNNFDTVNDTGVPCHGFEIELDDCRTADITYTYDYNHYGTPKLTEQASQDSLLVWHTNTFVRYEAVWTTNWSAYTAVPTNTIPPTAGHQFTNPNINFGGEHFGVGFRIQPTKIFYHWLIDNGGHALTRGPQVNISTPTFTYNPPPAPAQPAQVVAVIPAPILPQVNEFSDATWCKEIRTSTHTNTEMKIRDLMTPDPGDPTARDWRNGQPDEVEVEWQLLQTDYLSSDYNPTNGIGGPNGMLAAAAQPLSHSDDVETRRYEYYAYVGPYADPDTHEALAQSVAPDGIHGVGSTTINGVQVDLSTMVVVGKFLGAQMSGMAAAPPIGLIDHLPDGSLGTEYPTRSVIIAGDTNFVATSSGALPLGMAFDPGTGQVFGTPFETGVFIFTVSATSSNNPAVTKTYPFMISDAGAIVPPHCSIDIAMTPTNGGRASGTGVYTNGTSTTAVATANEGYQFLRWAENGVTVGTKASYTFTNIVNQSLIATFVPAPTLFYKRTSNAVVLAWPTNFSGFTLVQNADLTSTNWTGAIEPVNVVGTNHQATLLTTNFQRYFQLVHP